MYGTETTHREREAELSGGFLSCSMKWRTHLYEDPRGAIQSVFITLTLLDNTLDDNDPHP